MITSPLFTTPGTLVQVCVVRDTAQTFHKAMIREYAHHQLTFPRSLRAFIASKVQRYARWFMHACGIMCTATISRWLALAGPTTSRRYSCIDPRPGWIIYVNAHFGAILLGVVMWLAESVER